ncbi:unnamed protein product [Amoebophrya sp. A120]|nr:unnamed protein product [Amoebophrya sp. A120]|eukprot:GSA120T00018151001.1
MILARNTYLSPGGSLRSAASNTSLRLPAFQHNTVVGTAPTLTVTTSSASSSSSSRTVLGSRHDLLLPPRLLLPHRRTFLTASPARFGKGVGYGISENVIGGNRDTLYHYKRVRLSNNHQLPLERLTNFSRECVFDSKQKQSANMTKRDATEKTVEFTKFPGVVSKLGAEYYFREDQKSEQMRFFHMRTTSQDVAFVGSVDSRKRETRTVENCLHENTRGYAAQVIMEGRGVKLYWNPAYPKLAGRKGVGDKARDLTKFCKLDRQCKIHLNKVGNLATVTGPTRCQVGNVAMRLFWKLKQGVYTGKGAKLAFNWVKRKARNKK